MIKIKLATEKPIEDDNHWSYPFSELDYLVEEKEDGAVFLLYNGRLYETDEDTEAQEVKVDVDLEKFRYSLVGDGYLLEEVKKMSEEELVGILSNRIYWHIELEYDKGRRYGLYDGTR